MKFTVNELLQAGKNVWVFEKDNPMDDVLKRNLEDLVCKVNALGYTPPMFASSCLRSLEDQKRINPSAMGSSHLYGCAVDIKDPQGKLATWVNANKTKLEQCGLWCENPQYTKGWVHLQTYAPKSMSRFFNP